MTRLGDKVPVVRLDAARLARIEDAVVASIERVSPRPALRMRWLAAGAACAALLVAGYLGWRGVGAEPALMPSVATRPGESARIAVGGAVVELGGDTQVTVNGSDGVEIVLAQGRVDCEVEPRSRRAPFVVRAGDVAVEVVGTAFSVERDSDVRVSVTRGRVRVVRAGRDAVEVAAGESWARSGRALARADADRSAQLAASPEVPRTESGRELPRSQETTQAREPTTARESTARESTARESTARESTARESTARESTARESTAREPIREPRREATRSSPADGDESAGNGSPAQGLPTPSCPDVETCLAIALEQTGPEAGEALYGLVHHELFGERDPARAITHAELYERRFARRRPAEAEAVLWLRVLAHRQAGNLDSTRAAARSYLRLHPRGRFVEQAARHAD